MTKQMVNFRKFIFPLRLFQSLLIRFSIKIFIFIILMPLDSFFNVSDVCFKAITLLHTEQKGIIKLSVLFAFIQSTEFFILMLIVLLCSSICPFHTRYQECLFVIHRILDGEIQKVYKAIFFKGKKSQSTSAYAFINLYISYPSRRHIRM